SRSRALAPSAWASPEQASAPSAPLAVSPLVRRAVVRRWRAPRPQPIEAAVCQAWRKVERFGWTFAPGDKIMQIDGAARGGCRGLGSPAGFSAA
ncbi:MAG TPA: hypothetical protein VE087_00125, partial [Xanthobacteraceae bacterium]|nr:hypothetical protein [Xanthobacteraceae bacterium]